MKEQNEVIISTKVPGEDRMNFLPKYFGSLCVFAENRINSWMRGLSRKKEGEMFTGWIDEQEAHYDGGDWDFFELTNGGVFIAPNSRIKYRITVHGNYFNDILSAEAAGIVATLFALGELASMNSPMSDNFCELFHLLRDFAAEHPEGGKILSAID